MLESGMQWPDEISNLVKEIFTNDELKAYGQLATVDGEGQPSVRTVHIHGIEHPTQGLLINCNIQSEKWTDLKKNSRVAGCFWSLENQTQIRFEGVADLITEKEKDFNELLQMMWMKMRPEVRTTYLLDEKGIALDVQKPNVDPKHHSKNHGLLLITPHTWDVFQNNPKEYRLGKRWIYKLKNGQWKWREVNSLHEKSVASKP